MFVMFSMDAFSQAKCLLDKRRPTPYGSMISQPLHHDIGCTGKCFCRLWCSLYTGSYDGLRVSKGRSELQLYSEIWKIISDSRFKVFW